MKWRRMNWPSGTKRLSTMSWNGTRVNGTLRRRIVPTTPFSFAGTTKSRSDVSVRPFSQQVHVDDVLSICILARVIHTVHCRYHFELVAHVVRHALPDR